MFLVLPRSVHAEPVVRLGGRAPRTLPHEVQTRGDRLQHARRAEAVQLLLNTEAASS